MVRHGRGTSQTSLESFWLGTPFVKVERDSEKITINTYIYFEIKGTRWKYVSLLKYWNNQKSTTLSQTCVESHVFWTSSVLINAALSSSTIFFSVSNFYNIEISFYDCGVFFIQKFVKLLRDTKRNRRICVFNREQKFQCCNKRIRHWKNNVKPKEVQTNP